MRAGFCGDDDDVVGMDQKTCLRGKGVQMVLWFKWVSGLVGAVEEFV